MRDGRRASGSVLRLGMSEKAKMFEVGKIKTTKAAVTAPLRG